MKYKAFIFTAVSIYITTMSPILMSGDGKYVGKIGSIDINKKEVLINVEGGRTIKMGEQLYVRIGNKVVIMEATFPMQTTARCKLLKTDAGYFKNLQQGMSVYKYDRASLEDNDQTNKIGRVEKIGGIDFVKLPGGTFMMGSEDGNSNEKPIHKVTVDAFYISACEITQMQYKDIMGTNPSYSEGDNLPVEEVSWDDAMEFCKRFSTKYNVKARLPYEAEWEFACRAGTTTKYYWGDEANWDYAWYKRFGTDAFELRITYPVGQKKPNAFGLYDMSGNVLEWCMDWYGEDYYANSSLVNPEGPGSGNYRVLRGGTWFDGEYSVRSAYRNKLIPGGRGDAIGFRVVVLR